MLSPQAVKILEKRYLLRNKEGLLVETPDELFRRVAYAVAEAENVIEAPVWAGRFLGIMESLEFLPNSPCLANAGKKGGQLSACFVLPIEDSLESIFDTVKSAALIHRTGGGTGFSFSRIRAKGAVVASSGHEASGPVSFLRVFDAATQSIKQGGMRRGANMAVLSSDHPDVWEFVRCKKDGSISNFNISVAASDAFMNTLGGCGWPCSGTCKDAHKLWQEICEAAWQTGDPGLWFIDRVNQGSGNPVPSLGPIESPNPCGEQELYPWDACTLGSINLSKFVAKDRLDFARLGEVVRIAIRFLDDCIDVNHYPLPQIYDTVLSLRRIGLGVMGWADTLLALNIPYDSHGALALAEEVMEFIRDRADWASEEIAEEKGPYPLCPEEPIRNCTRTTIAPTGTISLIAGCSSGIEPIFAKEYRHLGLEGELVDEAIVRDVPALQTAHELPPEAHVKMQAMFQKYTDNSVSKTVNLKQSATVEDVSRAYWLAWTLGCKGITIYRDGSKSGVLVKEEKDHVDSIKPNSVVDTRNSSGEPIEVGFPHDTHPSRIGLTYGSRPNVLDSKTYKQPTGFGNLYVTVSESDGAPYEVFAVIGKAGSDVQAMTEAACRTVSKFLQRQEPEERREVLRAIADQWENIGGSYYNGFGKEKVRSVPDAISKVLVRYLGGDKTTKTGRGLCPECGLLGVTMLEGCEVCGECGWSRC